MTTGERMTTVEILFISAALAGVIGVWSAEHQTRLRAAERAEADYQLERRIHTNFPAGSIHELEAYGRVQFKRYAVYTTLPDQVTFWTAGQSGSYDRGESVTMSWRLFQELLIEESEE
jgi:hypothetical protein